MIFKLLFNKWTFLAAGGILANWNVNQVYEQATFTEEENAKVNDPNYTLTAEEQETIDHKRALQKKLSYKPISWYQGQKADWFAAAAEKLEPLRKKVETQKKGTPKS